MQNQWAQSANNFFIREVSQNVESLAKAVYKLEQDPRSGELYLSQVQDAFEFPYKIYGIETKFISRVIKTYANTTGNLGVLLNGVKGTGKTVTAKQICNKLNLPVIIIHEMYGGIPGFMNDIQQDVVIFIDEYEKIYKDRDHSVLTIMDGAMDNGFRKVFLLTTNELWINDNLIQRPGRVRYLKTYNDLSLDVIMEIVDDKLLHKKFREATIEFLSELETITVDIVKAVIEEINIHEEDPKEFKSVFNIKMIDDRSNVYEVSENKSTIVSSNVRVYPRKFTEERIGETFEIEGRYKGEIIAVLDEENIVVSVEHDEDDELVYNKHYRVESAKQKHRAFII